MKWSQVRFLGNSKLVQQNYIWIFLVPIFLNFVNVLNSKIIIFGETISLSLPFSWPYLYFCALSFATANLLYLVFCPVQIKEHKDYSSFKQAGYYFSKLNYYLKNVIKSKDNKLKNKIIEYSNNTDMELIDAGKTSVIEISKDDLYNLSLDFEKQLFWDIYETGEVNNKWALNFSIVLYSLGFGLLAIIFIQNFSYVYKYIFCCG